MKHRRQLGEDDAFLSVLKAVALGTVLVVAIQCLNLETGGRAAEKMGEVSERGKG
jgi:hypothetical protein